MSVTIKDVAKAAGTSVSTVSKVINGHYSISQQTAARVRQVMRDMDYYPSASAQSFARGATRDVTVLANLQPDAAFRNPHMFEIIAGLEQSLRARGYRLLLRGVDASDACEVAEDIICRRSSDALAVQVAVMTHPLSALLTKTQFPHIVLGMPNFESQLCWIDNNNVYSGTVAASFLLSHGYRRIAFLGGLYYDLGSMHRLQGLREGLRNSGYALDDRYIRLGESTRADGYAMAVRLLAERELPDAIVCANNCIALGCMAAIQDRGMCVPEDVGVLSFDDYPFSRLTQPQLSVVDIDVRDLGLRAGKHLVEIIRKPTLQVQMNVTASNIIERGSTSQR